ncbi:hypothetical protein AVEN_178383-1 [Araneus ventricosus]|uniref:Uncharacterized protein n=1 Tax=Araneus ventricosus TaxID=182803 RepID=A0A4Y2BCD9_ARAVE|nr:hypothetical protein AVEN_178383-1 [Araneus ventricosus]
MQEVLQSSKNWKCNSTSVLVPCPSNRFGCRNGFRYGAWGGVLSAFFPSVNTITKKTNPVKEQQEPQWPGGKVTTSGPGGFRDKTRFHQRSAVYVGLLSVKSDFEGQTSSCWCGAEVWRRYCRLRCRLGIWLGFKSMSVPK